MIRAAGRLAVFALLLLVWLAIPVCAQPPGPPSGPAEAAAQGDAQPPADPWDFPDEEQDVASTSENLRAQAMDLVLFAAFATLALVSFFRKSVRLKYVTLVASVVYLGFYKSQLISIVNVYGLLTMNLPVFRYSLAWYLFAVFTVVSTVLWGRLYCGRICAFGALTQLMDRVVPARLRVEVPRRIEDRAAWVKYGLLGGILVYFFVTRRHRGLSVRRAVLDVLPESDDRPVDRARRAARRDGLRQKSLLPVSLSARRGAGVAVQADGVPHQALVGVQHVQDLRESVRVGSDSRAENRDERVRAVR